MNAAVRGHFPQSPLKVVLTFLLLVVNSGCMMSVLKDPTPPPEGITALNENNPNELVLTVQSAPELDQTGHQYLFGILPFGTVTTKPAVPRTYNELFEELALRNFKVFPAHGNHDIATAKVTLKELSCTAYDLLVVRRNVCRIEGSLQLTNDRSPLSPVIPINAFRAEWARFGFTPQLESLLDQLLDEVADSSQLAIARYHPNTGWSGR